MLILLLSFWHVFYFLFSFLNSILLVLTCMYAHTHTHTHTRVCVCTHAKEEKRKSRKECLAAGGVAALYQQTYMSVAILFPFAQFPAV